MSERRLSLCLASPLFFPVYSGAALRFLRYAPGLRARGIDLHVFAATPSRERADASGVPRTWADVPAGQMLPVTFVGDVAVHRLRLPDDVPPRVRSALYAAALARHCRARRPDVVQLVQHTFDVVPLLWMLRRAGIGSVVANTVINAPGATSWKTLIRHAFWRVPFDAADAVVVNSRAMEQALRWVGVRRQIAVIPNGVDAARFHAPADAAEREEKRRGLGLGPDDPLLLSVGAVSPRKGAALLLETWRHLARRHPRARLVIAGPRIDRTDPALAAFHQTLERALESSGASDRVVFLGQVDDVPAWMRAADLLMFTSALEGLPNAVIEAMASRLPVVMTRFVGISAELGTNGREYLLCDRTPEAMAEACTALLEAPARREAMAAAAQRHILETMNLDRTVERYAALYRSVAPAA